METTRERELREEVSQTIRNINIDYYLNEDNINIIDTFFNHIWSDLYILSTNVYHKKGGEFILYNKNRDWIFFYDEYNSTIVCSKERFWDIFKALTNFTDFEIQEVSRVKIDNVLNINKKPYHASSGYLTNIDMALDDNIDKPLVQILKK